jgi:hypothetical protein
VLAAVDGAAPMRPPMHGLDSDEVLPTMSDTFALQHVLAAGGARSALIVEPHPRLPDEVVAAAGSPSAGLVALMMAEWRPSATWWVKVTDTSVKPASVSWDWYSAWDRAPAMQPT